MMKSESGMVTIELAIVSAIFFFVMLAVVEIARMAYTWNTLSAATQRAARVAVVCPPYHSAIKKVALFGEPGKDFANMPLTEIGKEHIRIDYLDENWSNTGGEFPISYVQVAISGYKHSFLVPMIGQLIESPAFTATLPVESLGYNPDTGVRSCFGQST